MFAMLKQHYLNAPFALVGLPVNTSPAQGQEEDQGKKDTPTTTSHQVSDNEPAPSGTGSE